MMRSLINPTTLDRDLIEKARTLRKDGAQSIDVLNFLLRHTKQLRDYYSVAFGIEFGHTKCINSWRFNGGDEARNDAIVNETLESYLSHSDYAAKFLVPEDMHERVQSHKEWLDSQGKRGTKLIATEYASTWRYLNFSSSNLQYSDYTNAHLKNCSFDRAIFDYALFDNSRLDDVTLNFSSLMNTNFKNSIIVFGSIAKANLSEANMDRTSIRFTDMIGIKANAFRMRDSALQSVRLKEANFECSNLSGTKFEQCDFSNSVFYSANLTGCVFQKTVLSGAIGLESVIASQIEIVDESSRFILRGVDAIEWLVESSKS